MLVNKDLKKTVLHDIRKALPNFSETANHVSRSHRLNQRTIQSTSS
jgi:hypothetical protein